VRRLVNDIQTFYAQLPTIGSIICQVLNSYF